MNINKKTVIFKLKKSDNCTKIKSTRGVSQIVSFNGVPATLDAIIIKQLKLHCALLSNSEPKSIVNLGDKVHIIDGCFKHIEAIVAASSGEERMALLLNLFNRE